LLPAAWSAAQEQNQQPPPDRGGGNNNQNGGGRGNGRGNFDPAQFQQRMMDDARDRLGASDDEWKVLQPKIEKLMTARRDAFSGGGPGGFGRGGRNRGGDGGGNRDSAGGPPPSALMQATDELRTTLDNKNATAEDISAKLKAVREAREKAQADVQSAQKDLKEVLTQRQEATLVSMGWLE